MITTQLRDKTLQLLQERPRSVTLRDIEFSTEIPEGWLKQFSRGRIKDPSVNRIETLYNFLTKTTLEV